MPSGSTLAIARIPFPVRGENITDFEVNQAGLNYNGKLRIFVRHGYTQFELFMMNNAESKKYVTDGSEGSVRFWGYIFYECN